MNDVNVLDKRRAGILLHITSLPNTWGNGDLGNSAYYFVNFLAKSKLSVWQMLPIHPLSNPTDLSPYQPQSVHAGNPLLISLEWLQQHGNHRWVHSVDPPSRSLSPQESACYRYQMLQKAYLGFKNGVNTDYSQRYEQFKIAQRHWLMDYALFRALKEKHGGQAWFDWGAPYRNRDQQALQQAQLELADNIDYCCFEQFVFFEQWQELQQYAHEKGVYLFGDMPFFAALDSADVWANRAEFLLNDEGMPEFVAGDPPSMAYPHGQCWGNPLYRWNKMQADGFSWWKARFRTAHQLFDLIRLTHFRGFVQCYAVPADTRRAESGHSEDSPGIVFFNALKTEFPDYASRWIAEDIGTREDVPDGGKVVRLRNDLKLMGMKLLQLAFYYKLYSDQLDLGNCHLPHHHLPDYVVYSGSHDGQMIRGWFSHLDEKRHNYVYSYLQIKDESDELWHFIETIFKSCAKLAIISMQDVLGLDNSARMNNPRQLDASNWTWRYSPAQLDDVTKMYGFVAEDKLAELAEWYERT